MKKLYFLFGIVFILFASCTGNDLAQMNYQREAKTAMYQSEYATTINKLEMAEGNFKTYRRVTFYNVRLNEIVFCCEGYVHVKIDSDNDVELVVKVNDGEYLRHYLGQKQDITYFSEQLMPNDIPDNNRYKILWNPKLWIPSLEIQ